MKNIKALVLTGYGLKCDYETDFSLKKAGAHSDRVHFNDLILEKNKGSERGFENYHILVFGGGFSWADDHGAGVVMAARLRYSVGEKIEEFVRQGKLVIGVCNGFQALVNLGLLPGFDGDYKSREVALVHNDSGNFVDTWVKLQTVNDSLCVFTKGISNIDLPVRHGEGKFYAPQGTIDRLIRENQVVLRYADNDGKPAENKWPFNPNGSLYDIAGICDSTGRVLGIMPHPEAYNHYTNHPEWVLKKEKMSRMNKNIEKEEGEGISIFRNAVEYIRENL
jgi:phosphoribosylformylglycinamidine synthase